MDFKPLWVSWSNVTCVSASLLRLPSRLKAAGKGITSWDLEETTAFPVGLILGWVRRCFKRQL